MNKPSPEALLQAIKQLIRGEYDEPELLSMGPLHTNKETNIVTWIVTHYPAKTKQLSFDEITDNDQKPE